MIRPIALALALTVPTLSTADPQSDAQFIVSQEMTKAIFEGAIRAQRPIIVSAIQNDLRTQGITLPDPDRFFDIFMEEFIGEFTASMQAQAAPIYLNAYSDEELAGIAAFYKTDAGQAMLRKAPELMMAGAQLGERAGLEAGEKVADRVAERLETEGINYFEDQSMMQRLLDALRQ